MNWRQIRSVLVFTGLLSAATGEVWAKTDCSTYRIGDLKESHLYLYFSPGKHIRNGGVQYTGERERAPIYYVPDYRRGPHFPCPDTGCYYETFQFDIQTGRPANLKDPEYRQNVKEYTHAAVSVSGSGLWGGLGKSIAGQAGRPLDTKTDEDAYDFEYTGDVLAGFRVIAYPNNNELSGRYARERNEVAIRLDEEGKFESFLVCRKIGSVPNPQCTYQGRIPRLWVSASFNRKQLRHIETIIRHTRTFAECLFVKPDESRGE